MNSRTIVISAVNLTSGGPLTILQECLGYLNSSPLLATYEVIALVHPVLNDEERRRIP